MKLTKLVVFNFRSFYGRHEIEFSLDPKKNVTLIHGENGTGKTALLNAILWCLFEKTTAKFKQPTELLCKEVEKEGGSEFYVELHFEHEGSHYSAIRKKTVTPQAMFVVSKIENGNSSEIPNAKNFVNSILPSDMADYFFFAGEGIQEISSKKDNKFRKAVRDILGFTFAEQAINDLGHVSKKWAENINNLAAGQKKLKELTQLQVDLVEIEKNLKAEVEGRVIVAGELREKCNLLIEKLQNSGDANANKLAKYIEQLKYDIKIMKNEMDVLNTDRQNLIQRYGWVIFGYELAEKSIEFIDQADYRGKIPSPYDQTLVTELLEDALCICGRELKEGTDSYERVQSMIVTASTGEIRQKFSRARTIGDKIKGSSKEFLQEINKLEERLRIKDQALRQKEIELIENEKSFQKINIESIKNDKILLTHAEKKIALINQEIGDKNGTLERIKSELVEVKKEIGYESQHDSKLSRLQKCQDVIDSMISRCEERLDQVEDNARETISLLVNSILEEFSRKDYSVRVTENFDFYLVRNDGLETGHSDGEGLLLNLAFVSALIKYAASRVGQGDDFIIGGTVAPFVIDAPFGELDKTYKPATATFLPKNAEQLVFLLSSSHWEGVEDAIRSRVGAEYLLINHTISKKDKKSDDVIEILKSKYSQTQFNSERNYTSIKRV